MLSIKDVCSMWKPHNCWCVPHKIWFLPYFLAINNWQTLAQGFVRPPMTKRENNQREKKNKKENQTKTWWRRKRPLAQGYLPSSTQQWRMNHTRHRHKGEEEEGLFPVAPLVSSPTKSSFNRHSFQSLRIKVSSRCRFPAPSQRGRRKSHPSRETGLVRRRGITGWRSVKRRAEWRERCLTSRGSLNTEPPNFSEFCRLAKRLPFCCQCHLAADNSDKGEKTWPKKVVLVDQSSRTCCFPFSFFHFTIYGQLQLHTTNFERSFILKYSAVLSTGQLRDSLPFPIFHPNHNQNKKKQRAHHDYIPTDLFFSFRHEIISLIRLVLV